MNVKVLELRDAGTFIPLFCVDMNPVPPYPLNGALTIDQLKENVEAGNAQRYLLRRCGYPCDGEPNIAITHLSADGKPFNNDPYAWGGRTYPVAHDYIIKNWATLKDGDVVDVQFILGETSTKKLSEREEASRSSA